MHDPRGTEARPRGGGIPDGVLVGLLAFLLGLAVLVWSATGLAALFAKGAWPATVTFTRTPGAVRALITQPHDVPGAWPDTDPTALSGWGLFWGLFISQLLVLLVLTIFTLGVVTRAKARRRTRAKATAPTANPDPASDDHPRRTTPAGRPPAHGPDSLPAAGPGPDGDTRPATPRTDRAPATATHSPYDAADPATRDRGRSTTALSGPRTGSAPHPDAHTAHLPPDPVPGPADGTAPPRDPASTPGSDGDPHRIPEAAPLTARGPAGSAPGPYPTPGAPHPAAGPSHPPHGPTTAPPAVPAPARPAGSLPAAHAPVSAPAPAHAPARTAPPAAPAQEAYRYGFGYAPAARAATPQPTAHRLAYAPPAERRRLAVQAVSAAEGAVLVVTSSPAVWQDTKDARAKLGPVLLYDPAHLCDTPARLHWNPAEGCADRDTAAARAIALLAPVRPQARLDAAVADTAETLLRSWLQAAALDGLPFKQLARWAQGNGSQEPVRILRTHPQAAPGAAGELESALIAHPERREQAQYLTARALACLTSVHIREACNPHRTDALTLASFAAEGGTLYVVGEPLEDPRTRPGAMPLLTALASHVVEHGRRMAARSSHGRLDPPMTLVLEDVAAVAPVPQLPDLLHEHDEKLPLLALCRSREQARARWPEWPA
ncbi:type VI secretion protein [Streptomyces racemochromogenes]|uniref:Type VI secretion protein n=1 Tax=Streptomyces racemochromogenes TaxID=67353 RepID=A0ABW7P5P7_9ACTN